MKRNILVWASVGALVAVFWAIYAAATFPAPLTSPPMLWSLAEITCPIAYASVHFHFGVKLYWAIVANAITYATIGLMVETARRQFRHA